MNEKIEPYHIVELPPGRRIWVNTLDLSWPAHTIYGLLEVDVTVARRLIAEHKARTARRSPLPLLDLLPGPCGGRGQIDPGLPQGR